MDGGLFHYAGLIFVTQVAVSCTNKKIFRGKNVQFYKVDLSYNTVLTQDVLTGLIFFLFHKHYKIIFVCFTVKMYIHIWCNICLCYLIWTRK